MKKEKILIIKLTSYQGNDTALKVIPNPLYIVVNAKTGIEIDNGYRSYEEAKETYKYSFKVINKEV